MRGYYPSALLIFVIFYSINNDHWEAIKISIFAGMLQDLYFCQVFGINPLVNMFICLAAAEIGENIFRVKGTYTGIFSISFDVC
jgi:rod shape-determining protein MreD.